MKKVSIVIITYNQQEFIHETLESCLAQSYPEFEIIVCDDGSSDNTARIIKQYSENYPEKIIPVLHPINTGIAENSNRGMRLVTGDFVIWFGGDDIMLPEKIKAQVEYLECHPEFSACYHDAEVFEWPSNKVLGIFSELFGFGKFEIIDIKKYLNAKYKLLPSTFMMRRAAIGNRLFDTRIVMMNDYLFFAEFFLIGGPSGFIDDVLIRYRKSSKSVGQSAYAMKFGFEEHMMTFAILEARYPEYAQLIGKLTRHHIALAAARQIKIGNVARFRGLCLLLISKGGWVKGRLLRWFGAPLITYLYKYHSSYLPIINRIRRWI